MRESLILSSIFMSFCSVQLSGQGVFRMQNVATSAPASISRDASDKVLEASGNTSVTKAFTIGNLTNGVIIVAVWNNNVTSGTGFSSATFNGGAMTVIAGPLYGTSSSTTQPITLLYRALGTISAGTYNLVVSGMDSLQFYQFDMVTYSGASQTAPTNVVTDNTTLTTSLTLSLTTAANNSWMVAAFHNKSGDPLTGGSGATVLQQSSGTGLADSNAAQTPAGSHSMTVTGDLQIYGLMVELPHA